MSSILAILAAFVIFVIAAVILLRLFLVQTKPSDEKKRDDGNEFRPNFDPYRDQMTSRVAGDLRLRQTGAAGSSTHALPRPHIPQKTAGAPPIHQQIQPHVQQQIQPQIHQIIQPLIQKQIQPPAFHGAPSFTQSPQLPVQHQNNLNPVMVGQVRVTAQPIVNKPAIALDAPLHVPLPPAPPPQPIPGPLESDKSFKCIEGSCLVSPAQDIVAAPSAALTKQLPSIHLKDLSLSTVLGGGAFGQVWRGNWRGTPVAVKVLSAACQSAIPEAVLRAFEDEVSMLSGLRHPNICLFMGVCLDPTNRAIVTELVSRGSLWDVLRTQGLFVAHTGPAFWPWWAIRKVLDGTCKGLAYLHAHDPPIIHRDLKSANLLLDDAFNVKICDFGLARLRDLQNTMTANVGTLQVMRVEFRNELLIIIILCF